MIQQDQVQPADFTTHYRSAIVFGRARPLTGAIEKRRTLEYLLEKYAPAHMAAGRAEIEREWERVCVVELTIDHMTAKAAKEILTGEA